jgi:hypothetical protein
MGRPKADLCSYSPWGCVPIPKPEPPNPLWLPLVPNAAVQTWSDLAVFAMGLNIVEPWLAPFVNFYQVNSESTLANFTASTDSSLRPQRIAAPTFGGLNDCGRAIWNWPAVTFTADLAAVGTILWGWYAYCTDPITGLQALLQCQNFPTAVPIIAAGQTVPISMQAAFGQC